MKIIKVTIEDHLNKNLVEKVDRDAFILFGCQGKLEYNIEEERVDEILGEKAFCGGELEDELYNIIEQEMKKESTPSFFWMADNKKHVDNFKKYLSELEITYKVENLDKEDWNEKWRENFNEIKVSHDLSVIPSWEKKAKGKDIFIYPGMGFGTGNHETTYLCLKEFLALDLINDFNCLDFGCGSGILGIAAMKKGSSLVDFVDIDVEALDNCVINLELNDHLDYKCEKSIILRERFLLKDKKYDLVFANILENVLVIEKKVLLGAGKKGGHLIVSGLLKHQVDNIKEEYKDLTFVASHDLGDWSTIIFKYI